MKKTVFLPLRNGVPAPRTRIPVSTLETLRHAVVGAVARGKRLAAMFASIPEEGGRPELSCLVADDAAGRLAIGLAPLPDDDFPSFTPDCPQAHLFERELAEQYSLHPVGHPRLHPVRFHPSWRSGANVWGRTDGEWPVVGEMDYYRVEGEEVHEVAVGPVHAGVIEPGHFRFQCAGERVFHLEISLGYQHRGVERALLGGPHPRTMTQMETVAGDTTVGHSLAYCQALEGLSGTNPPARAHAIRAIGLELERLANHIGDLGALAGDVAFLPTASFCGRLRGDFLNLSAEICGSRFGRGLVRPGGTPFDLDAKRVASLRERLAAAARDTREAIRLLLDSPTVLARFEGTGIVARGVCEELGIVGPPARAAGIGRDVRHDFPVGIYPYVHLPLMTADDGDVYSRALVRWHEIQQSIAFVDERLAGLPATAILAPLGTPKPDSIVASLVEGWRGEICHVASTGPDGRFLRYKIVDPSFHNWSALAMALRDAEISDFPLCNKSFNLSYCGHDL
jgi:Ni,Fe-hydrogenase III large subunit